MSCARCSPGDKVTFCDTPCVKKSFRLPSYVGTRNTEQLFDFCTAVQNHPGELEIDARDLKFLDPLGLAVLSALLSPRCAAQTVTLSWLNVKIAAYLDRMDFFTHCPVEGVYIPPGATRSDLRRTLVEITPVTEAWETERTASRLATALTGRMTGLTQPETVDFSAPPSEFESFNRPIQYALNYKRLFTIFSMGFLHLGENNQNGI